MRSLREVPHSSGYSTSRKETEREREKNLWNNKNWTNRVLFGPYRRRFRLLRSGDPAVSGCTSRSIARATDGGKETLSGERGGQPSPAQCPAQSVALCCSVSSYSPAKISLYGLRGVFSRLYAVNGAAASTTARMVSHTTIWA